MARPAVALPDGDRPRDYRRPLVRAPVFRAESRHGNDAIDLQEEAPGEYD